MSINNKYTPEEELYKWLHLALNESDEGNTKPHRVSASWHWAFTWNNYPEDWLEIVAPNHKDLRGYIYAKEVGESGTPHIQGQISYIKKSRPLEGNKWPAQIHWKKTINLKASIKYCVKDGDFVSEGYDLPPIIKCITLEGMYPFQRQVVDTANGEPDDRTIHWYYDEDGNSGKSQLCKYLCMRMGAIICSGTAKDMKYMISECIKKNRYPRIVVFDVPRSMAGYISYTGIEEIKNGCFCSSKYESGMVVMNSPHVFVFSNSEPDYDRMSMDRWNVVDIGNL